MSTPSATRPGQSPDTTFAGLFADHSAAIRLHCYRMLASLEDAEDALQETMLRAWSRRETLREPAAVRSWLYRIATNVCLDQRARRPRRWLPQDRGPAEGTWPPTAPMVEMDWLEPLPGAWLEGIADPSETPEAAAEQRESVRLAFVAALQHVPPRQRASVILADVLDWSARDIAESLNTSTAAVNSALQRGRGTLRAAFPDGMPARLDGTSARDEALLDRYIRYWEEGDLAGLASLLTEDAELAMPPSLDWYRGRAMVVDFFRWAWSPAAGLGPFRLLPIVANGERGVGLYGKGGGSGDYQALAIKVLDADGAAVRAITGFVSPALFPAFGLPPALSGV